MKKLYTIAAALLVAATSQAQVVISQAYGGGGNNGSTYTHDFVELFNRGTTAVNIGGWTLQYASATGSNWSTVNGPNGTPQFELPNVTIQPGKYYLIQQAQGNGGTTALPTPDLVPAFPLAMGGSAFKIALVNNNTILTGTNPTDASIVDMIGAGATASSFEGSGPAPAPSATNAVLRANNGCQDTNDNAADFVSTVATPRNSATAANVCETAGVKENNISGLKLFPNPLSGSVLNVTSNSSADKTIAVYDVLGKNVLNAKVTNEAVNVSGLNSGVYIVKITEEGKTATRKLVVK